MPRSASRACSPRSRDHLEEGKEEPRRFPEIHVEEGNPKAVFLIWRCPSSGLAHCTDTFLFDDAGKIVRQYVVQLTEGAPAGKAPLCTEPAGGPVQASWDNHFAAFGGQDVDKILKDYTDAKRFVIKVYDQITGELAEFKGLKGVKELFTGLFKDLHDTSGLAAPAIRVEERGASEGIAGRRSSCAYVALPDAGLHARDRHLPLRRGRQDREAEHRLHPRRRASSQVSGHDVTSTHMPM